MNTENRYGVCVKRCCASCQHKDITRLRRMRWCTKHRKQVKPGDCCRAWQMSEALRELRVKN